MPQSFASMHVHIVFSTKHRAPFLDAELAPRMHAYLGGIARNRKCVPVRIGGVEDHVHLLVGLARDESVADLVRDLKSNSTGWMHVEHQQPAFAWQVGYAAFSVSYSNLSAVSDYIDHQPEHHRTRSFQDEFRDFLVKHEIAFDEHRMWE